MVTRHLSRRARAAVLLGLVLVAVASWGCSVGNVKEPKYAVVSQAGDFEIREYGPRVVAETQVSGEWGEAGNEGFRRLAGYIFGKNKGRTKLAMTAPVAQRVDASGGEKIAMTAPVAQRRDGDSWTISFTMPEGETLATLPAPEDERVVFRELAPTSVAVVRFSGRWTVDRMEERTKALRAWVSLRGLDPSGEAEVNRYDPPFMPWFMRRNEVWLKVQPTKDAP